MARRLHVPPGGGTGGGGATGLAWTTKADVDFAAMASTGSLANGPVVFEDGTQATVANAGGGTVGVVHGTGLELAAGASYASLGFALSQWATLTPDTIWRTVFKLVASTVYASDYLAVYLGDKPTAETFVTWSDYSSNSGTQLRVRDDSAYNDHAGLSPDPYPADPLFTAWEVRGMGLGVNHYAGSPSWASGVPGPTAIRRRGVSGVWAKAAADVCDLPAGYPVVIPAIVNGGVTRGAMSIGRMVLQVLQ